MLRNLLADARELARAAGVPKEVLGLALGTDAFRILVLQRAREGARALRVPFANHALRFAQSAAFGIEINNDVVLGEGVYFVHPQAIVIGGNARIGNRVKFYGGNTIGTVKNDGYPVIEDDVEIGAGARILGPIRIGARSAIGANAVVLTDVPPDSVAMGIPARVRPRR